VREVEGLIEEPWMSMMEVGCVVDTTTAVEHQGAGARAVGQGPVVTWAEVGDVAVKECIPKCKGPAVMPEMVLVDPEVARIGVGGVGKPTMGVECNTEVQDLIGTSGDKGGVVIMHDIDVNMAGERPVARPEMVIAELEVVRVAVSRVIEVFGVAEVGNAREVGTAWNSPARHDAEAEEAATEGGVGVKVEEQAGV
jgi:hypothetical protein